MYRKMVLVAMFLLFAGNICYADYRKEGEDIIEYVVITASEQVVGRYTKEQFDAKIAALDAQVKQDPKVIGDRVISGAQKKLNDALAVK